MNYIVVTVIISIIACDQVIKSIIESSMKFGQTIPVLDGIFHITFVQNFGAAFSILQNKQLFLIVVTTLVMAALFIILIRNTREIAPMLSISLSMIIGGGVGNLIDRISRGYVVDYLDARIIDFPVFNFADTCIVCGSAFMIFYVLFLSGGTTWKQ